MQLKEEKTGHLYLSEGRSILGLYVIFVLIVAYFVLRYGAWWGGGMDPSFFTTSIREMLNTNKLIPDILVYPNGYGYQAVTIILVQLTGLNLVFMQEIGSKIVALWVLLPIWLFFREITGTRRAAVLATIIMLVQPEFLFAILRGTHEYYSRGLMFLCLYFLVRSFRAWKNTMHFFNYVICFYLCAYALITFNNLLATSFILSLGIALIFSWIIFWRLKILPSNIIPIRRLLYAAITCVVLAFIYTFFVYAPAQNNILLMDSIWERIGALILDMEEKAANPYGTIYSSWVNLPIYFILSLSNWLLLAISALIWLGQLVSMVLGRWEKKFANIILLWAFYGAFAFLGAITILVDLSGVLAQNLQHRLFPAFAMLAAPLTASWYSLWVPKRKWIKQKISILGRFGFAVLFIFSVMKATTEPLLSNKWRVVLPGEVEAVEWSLENIGEEEMIWVGYDERLTARVFTEGLASKINRRVDNREIDPRTKNILFSDLIFLRSIRISQPIPIGYDDYLIYDNGHAKIFHTRSHSYYQP
ncbi:hypothetical protein ACFLYP_03615 [Chloroflexota bacterium]